MRPSEPLFARFGSKIEEITPTLFAYDETRKVTTDILDYARENGNPVGLPRLGHYKTALQRALNLTA